MGISESPKHHAVLCTKETANRGLLWLKIELKENKSELTHESNSLAFHGVLDDSSHPFRF